jgi:hypothetical protein
MGLRGHKPISIENFKGLWQQGDVEEVPQDHFTDCENIQFSSSGNFKTRFGVNKHQNIAVPLGNVVRIYNYVTQDANTLLALTYDGTTGNIYHVTSPTTIFGPILTKAGMEDFAFVPYAGRAYISPFKTYNTGGVNIEKGLQNEFLYVYRGLGAAAIQAAGAGLGGGLTVANGIAGNTDAGLHLFAVVGETNTGYLTPPSGFITFTTGAALSVSFGTIPTGPANIVKRHIVATKVIPTYNGNTTGYTYYFIPNGTINDNVTTTLINISFFDADLLEDASYLLDNYATIPAGASLSLYHNRLVLATTFTDISLVLVSASGEPEAINQIDGLIVVPPDGTPITQSQELRDVLYIFKKNKTVSFTDNDETPSSWPLTIVDQALGSSVHGIATVIDSGGSSVDFLIIATQRGICLFTGKYMLPELTWKIHAFWLAQSKSNYRYIQLVNDAINQILYCVLPDRRILYGDYSNGMDPMEIRWSPWRFDFKTNSIALINTSELIIASEGGL